MNPRFKLGLLAAAVITAGVVVYRLNKHNEPEQEAPQPKAETLEPSQAAKREIMRELARKGGKKSAETRRKAKAQPVQAA